MSNIFYDYLMLPFSLALYLFKSAGPAKESKAEKRKKEKKGAKGWGGGANRPVSGKPGKKDVQISKDQVEMSKHNNLSPEQEKMQLNHENNVQANEDIDKSEGNEANFTDQNSSISRETGVDENNEENLVIDNETMNNEKANLWDKSTEEESISSQVNKEENSVGAVYNEGTVTAYRCYATVSASLKAWPKFFKFVVCNPR